MARKQARPNASRQVILEPFQFAQDHQVLMNFSHRIGESPSSCPVGTAARPCPRPTRTGPAACLTPQAGQGLAPVPTVAVVEQKNG